MKCMLTMVAVVAAVMGSSAMAQDAGAAKPHKAAKAVEHAAAADLTVKGTISKVEETSKKDGKQVVHYILTEADGKIVTLPEAHGHKGKEGAAVAAISFADYVGKSVTVTGKGFETKKGARMTEVTKVDVDAAAPAAASAVAPVAAPAAAK